MSIPINSRANPANVERVLVKKADPQLPYDQWDDNVLTVRATTLAHTIPRMQAELSAVRKEIKKRKKARAGT
jgi:hypothetical protein